MAHARERDLMSEQLWPEPEWRPLAARLAAAPDRDLRRVAAAAALLAARRAFGDPSPLGRALDVMRAQGWGDEAARAHAQEVADAHDAAGFEAQERVDAGDAAAQADYEREFARARAALAVRAALAPDPADAARESLYEARHGVDDDEALRAVVQEALAGEAAP